MASDTKSALQATTDKVHKFLSRLLALRPEWPLALALVLSGAMNIETGLRYNLVPFSKIVPLTVVGRSLAPAPIRT